MSDIRLNCPVTKSLCRKLIRCGAMPARPVQERTRSPTLPQSCTSLEREEPALWESQKARAAPLKPGKAPAPPPCARVGGVDGAELAALAPPMPTVVGGVPDEPLPVLSSVGMPCMAQILPQS